MEVQKKIRAMACAEISKKSSNFSKVGVGEYGYGDIFLGVRTPFVRALAKEYIDLNISDVKILIKSKYHEERLLGLIILVNKYGKAKSDNDKERFYQIYIKSFKYINCWDLVDVTCPHIVGKHLIDKDRSVLYSWAKSDHLWTKRIAMITNWWFVRKGDLEDVFDIAQILLDDDHDLIHKAVGWMLREAAKKDMPRTEKFLKNRYSKMPRTMLRYAIERFPEGKRQKYLKGKI